MSVSLRAIVPKKFRIINPGRVEIEMRAGMREYLEEVKKIMQDNYETAEPSPSYTRTNKMRRGWRVAVRSNNFGELTNSVRYTGLVQGPNRPSVNERVRQQARFRRRGWKSISDVVRDTKHRYERVMNRRIRSTLERR
jgi:hypothetical protein